MRATEKVARVFELASGLRFRDRFDGFAVAAPLLAAPPALDAEEPPVLPAGVLFFFEADFGLDVEPLALAAGVLMASKAGSLLAFCKKKRETEVASIEGEHTVDVRGLRGTGSGNSVQQGDSTVHPPLLSLQCTWQDS